MQLISVLSDESKWDDPCWEKWKEVGRARGITQGMVLANKGRRKIKKKDKKRRRQRGKYLPNFTVL